MIQVQTASEAKKPLPKGWRWVNLGEVCKFQHGSTPSKANEAYWNGDILWVSPKDMYADLITTSQDRISHQALQETRIAQVPEGTVLIVIRSGVLAHTLPVAIAGQPLTFNQDIKAVLPKHGTLNSDYLRWFLLFNEEHILAQGIKQGPTVHSIRSGFIEAFRFPLPPLPEQQRITEILREQMASVEKARAAAQARLEVIKAMPAAYLRQVFPQHGKPLPSGWRWGKLGDVCQFIGGSQPSKGNFKYEPTLGYVRLVQIQDFRRSDVAVFIPQEMAMRNFDETDVMIGRYGPPVFQILRGLSGAYNVALMKTAPSEQLDKKFLYYLLQWPKIQRDVIAKSQRAAGQSGVQKEYLEKYIVPLPPLNQQRILADRLNSQMSSIEKIRKTVVQELQTINALPAALLQRAFSGEI